MSSPILPVTRSLILCDAVSQHVAGKFNVANTFNAIRAATYPHAGTRIVVYAQLTGGIGRVPIQIEIRHVGSDEVVFSMGPRMLEFPDRITVIHLSVVVANCEFPRPGLYTVELFCHNQFVCDTTLEMLMPGGLQ